MNLTRELGSFVKHRIFGELYRPADFRSAKRRLSESDAWSDEEKALLGKVSSRVYPGDVMYVECSNFAEYLSAGLSAIRCIEHAFKESNRDYHVQTILDFPSGYGRVLRFLKARFPDANITVSEIDPIALDFCRDVFSVKTKISNADFTRLSMPGKFDLIWCGSLITHIDDKAATDLLRFFHDHLAPNGLCVFTTHGRRAVELIENKTHTFALTEDEQEQLLSEFHAKGYGYVDSRPISLVSYERMLAIAGSVGHWGPTSYLPHGWDELQDVYGFAFEDIHREL
jgi:SAM-dependent methyltransferase